MSVSSSLLALAALLLGAPELAPPGTAIDPGSAPSPRTLPKEHVLVTQGGQSITLEDLDAALERMPAHRRAAYINHEQRRTIEINRLLSNRQLAALAVSEGLLEDPVVEKQLQLAREDVLARIQLDRMLAASAEPNYAALAAERYATDPNRYIREERVDVSHILIRVEDRTDDEARALANEIATKLAAPGANLAELAKRYSEDASSRDQGGRLGELEASKLDPAFAASVATLSEPNAIAGPVRTGFGYHVVQLHKRVPARVPAFEEIRDELIAAERSSFEKSRRQRLLAEVRGQDFEQDDATMARLAERYDE